MSSVERFTGKETGRDSQRESKTQLASTGKHRHHQKPKPSEPQPQKAVRAYAELLVCMATRTQSDSSALSP